MSLMFTKNHPVSSKAENDEKTKKHDGVAWFSTEPLSEPGTGEDDAIAETTAAPPVTTATSNDDKARSGVMDCNIPSCAGPVGVPLPRDEHACSVSLPTWGSVVGYEEGDPNVTNQMSCGYPRFVYHPYVVQLMEYVVGDDATKDCLILPSPEAAARCQSFLLQALHKKQYGSTVQDIASVTPDDVIADPNCPIQLQSLPNGITAVVFEAESLSAIEAKAYWQHTGEAVSSRRAECALKHLNVPLQHPTAAPTLISHHSAKESCDSVYSKLQHRIASLANVPPSHVHLAASGMASIYAALRTCRAHKDGASIVYGFPYLDTLKMCSRTEFSPHGVEFFGKGDADDLEHLKTLLADSQPNDGSSSSSSYCALFTEVPSNPLLRTPDVAALRELADEHGFALVVDDTIGNFANIDVLGKHGSNTAADMVCTSLTKLFSGRGDAMAGSLIVNPRTERGQQLQAHLEKHKSNSNDPHDGLFAADAWAVYHNSHDFLERNERINETSEQLCDWLRSHPDVATVYYPKFTTPELYSRVQTGGYGGLLSLLLSDHVCQRTFFDALDVAKGPSLGTNFTLMCPYTLLAHYHELDFAMAHGVQPNLLRIAVGLEPLETLRGKFEAAFEQSRLHPPLPKSQQAQLQQAQQQWRSYSTISGGNRRSNTSSSRNNAARWMRRGVHMGRLLLK